MFYLHNNRWALILLAVCALLHSFNMQNSSITLVSAMLYCVGIYAIIMLFIDPTLYAWGLMPLCLMIAVMPVSYTLNTLFGFPLRYAMAQIIHGILALQGIDSIASETVILIENRVANIDMTCSGMQGFSSAFIIYFSLSWIEKKRIALPWFLLLVLFLGAVLAGNFFRVYILVLLYAVYQKELLANSIHLLLGMLGFVIPATITFILFKKTKWFSEFERKNNVKKPVKTVWPFFVAVALIVLGILVEPPFSKDRAVPKKIVFEKVDSLNMVDNELTKGERILIREYPVDNFCKKRFTSGKLSGSIIMTKSSHYRAQHNPDLCLQSNGYRITDSKIMYIDTAFTVRQLSLNRGEASAFYWFTSADRTTGDYTERMWSHFSKREKEWVLTTVVFDGKIVCTDPDALKIINLLQIKVKKLIKRSNDGDQFSS